MGNLRITRRGFIQGVSALSFAFALGPRSARGTKPQAFVPHGILRIDPDNTVHVTMPHAEFGQGAYTGMAQILADELDADWQYVIAEHLESLDADFKHTQWGAIATGASTSINNQWQNLRTIGATARAMLINAAAKQWDVDAASLSAANSYVIDRNSKRRLSYGELTEMAATLTPPENVSLKSPQDFTLIGKSVQRIDSQVKAEGAAQFGIDVQRPNALVAAIAHCPIFGGKLKSYDASAAENMPGVKAVVEIPTGVAVVADTFWQAKTAKEALKIEWQDTEFESTSSTDLWKQYSELADTDGPVFEQRGALKLDDSATILEGEMRFPFLAHAPMEPLNATVQIDGDGCEIWAGTQFQGIDAGNLQQLAGVDPAKLTIHTQWLGGSFGRRAAPQADFLVEAVQIAKAANLPNPIKLIWQREDDIQGGFYRPMVLHRYKIALDDNNYPVQWLHRVVGASISKGTAFEAAFMVDGLDTLSTEGLRHNKYRVNNVRYELHTPKHPIPVLWWRAEADSHTGPVVETIINRLARAANKDPFIFRQELLKGNEEAQRIVGVLSALEKASDWQLKSADDIYKGMAVHPSFGSVCGYVVELKKHGNTLHFHKVTAAMDCGLVVNPESVKSQIFGAVAFALSTFVGQVVEIENGQAKQSNFGDYQVARLNETPDVDVVLVDNGLDHPTGVGEVGVAPFIPALAEAIYQATGKEINEFPTDLSAFSFQRT